MSARLDGSEVPAVGDTVSISVRGSALSFPAGSPPGTIPLQELPEGLQELPEGTVLAGSTVPEQTPATPAPLA